MLHETDFSIDEEVLRFKHNTYSVSRINDIRVKKLNLMDNVWQILYWVCVFSGALWIVKLGFHIDWLWYQSLVYGLTLVGLAVGVLRCGRYALQIEFFHTDETGLQWISVARSASQHDLALLYQENEQLGQKCFNRNMLSMPMGVTN